MIDLRSDTVTRPSAGMLAAMTSAPVGDDVYGEDPTINRLEETVAGLLGHEAGLFTVTGSLANMLGVRALVPRGGEVLCEASAHIVRAELGAHAAVSGVTTRTWSAPAGQIDLEQIRALIAPDLGPYFVTTSAVSVENTHNFGGGAIQHQYDALADELDARGLPLHLDGARLWNASVAAGVPASAYASRAAAVSVCLSKGLGAPVGSVLVGSTELIREARVWRKRLGAGWRQAGVLAAAGLYALEHNVRAPRRRPRQRPPDRGNPGRRRPRLGQTRPGGNQHRRGRPLRHRHTRASSGRVRPLRRSVGQRRRPHSPPRGNPPRRIDRRLPRRRGNPRPPGQLSTEVSISRAPR